MEPMARLTAFWLVMALVLAFAITRAATAQADSPGKVNPLVYWQGQKRSPADSAADAGERLAALPPERQLQYFQMVEKDLLERYGPEHPEVRAVRARLRVLLEFLASQPTAAKTDRECVMPSKVSPAPIPEIAKVTATSEASATPLPGSPLAEFRTTGSEPIHVSDKSSDHGAAPLSTPPAPERPSPASPPEMALVQLIWLVPSMLL